MTNTSMPIRAWILKFPAHRVPSRPASCLQTPTLPCRGWVLAHSSPPASERKKTQEAH
jgi:hypothetical protein